jgi:cardiolipin synthase A/B
VKLLSPTQYVQAAAAAVERATTRVYVISMVIGDHDETHVLMEALQSAARRGVEVVVAADIFTYGEVGGGFLPFRYYSHGTRNTNRMVRNLKKAGVHFNWLGRGRITLFHGRTHTKWCIVDDLVFTFGGVNLYDEGVRNIDYMFQLHDKKLADRLVQEQVRIQIAERRSKNYPTVTYEHENMTIMIDGGIIGQSVIYRRAIELAEQADHITFVSQYPPTGRLARILKKKNATLYYNRPLQAEGLNRIVIRISQLLSGLRTQYTRAQYLHAKCIIFTLSDGSKVAITGSHNFAYTGVLLGTRELALETKDPSVLKQLEKFVKNEVVLES